MDVKYELRAFIRNNRVVCASQQFTEICFNYSMEEIEGMMNALEKFEFDCPYSEWTADLSYNPETRKLTLIECNVYGCYSGCGSALFNWIDDWNVFNGTVEGEFRILSHVNLGD